MSSTSQTSSQATANMSGTNKNSESSPEATNNLESPTSATKHTGDQFKDSGYYENDSISYEYAGDKDFILYDEHTTREEYTFDVEEPVDIASIKANHGSLFNKTGNSSSQSYSQYQAPSSSQYHYQYVQEEVEIVEEEEEEDDRPRHRFSTPIDNITEKGFSTLDEWSMTYHRHESIAYRFEQPPNPTYVFHDLQPSWGYDVDIELS